MSDTLFAILTLTGLFGSLAYVGYSMRKVQEATFYLYMMLVGGLLMVGINVGLVIIMNAIIGFIYAFIAWRNQKAGKTA